MDILISADTIEEHDDIVRNVIQRARDYNTKLYCVQEVKSLGMIFNKNGMSLTQKNISY